MIGYYDGRKGPVAVALSQNLISFHKGCHASAWTPKMIRKESKTQLFYNWHLPEIIQKWRNNVKGQITRFSFQRERVLMPLVVRFFFPRFLISHWCDNW
jgi:hypothetical protein